MRIGLLFRALGAAGRPGQCGSPDRAQLPSRRERHPRRDRREPRLVGGVRGAHELPGTERLRGRLAHRGARPPGLQRRRASRPPAARCSPTRRRSGWTRTGRRPRSTSRSCSRRSCRCPARAPGCIYTWPGYQRPEPPTLALYTYPGDGVVGRDEPVPVRASRFGGGIGEGTLSDASLIGPGRPGRRERDRQPHAGRRGLPPAGRHPRPRPQPLEDDSTYTAQVTFTSDEGVQATRRWTLQHRRAAARRPSSRPARPTRTATHRRAAAERPHAADDARRCGPIGGGARATIAAQGNARRAHRAGHAAAHRLPAAGRRSGPSGSPRSGRRFESRGRPRARHGVARRASSPDDIPYRGLTLVRTLS